MKLSTAKKIHPETGGWFLEAYSVMMNFRAKVTISIAKGINSIAKWTNSIAKVTNSFANWTNSIAKATNSIAKTCNIAYSTVRITVLQYHTLVRCALRHNTVRTIS